MSRTDNLTERQNEIYQFIRKKILTRGYGPTVREIAEHFNIRSPNGVMCHLRALEAKRYIARSPNLSRAIRLLGDRPAAESVQRSNEARVNGLPLLGRIAAGRLHEAVENAESIDFHQVFDNRHRNLFVLQVRGDSMIDAQIADGDYVVVRRQETAEPGSIVVVLTDDNETTLKRWFPERHRIRLQPANKKMKPIYVRQARVLGVVVGVVRKLGA